MKRILFFTFLFSLSIIEIATPIPKNEIRAVWLTTDYALDWPSKPFKALEDIAKQKEELVNILYCLKEANFNMVFFQTRLRGNVVYNSKIEPMSSFIIDKGCKETYDPLSFAIEECHKLGLECHAWFVTYPLGTEKIKCLSAIERNRLRIGKYKGVVYLDPGDPGTNEYLLSIIEEIIGKYDIDGIHMDYIRYPEKHAEFPDDITYKLHGKGKNKTEWRKENINLFVSRLYDTVKEKKPWVQISSAVVGMYTQIPGNNQRHWTANEVCQDPEQWLRMGKHDFVVPMMYYSNDLFFSFIRDWQARSHGRFIVPGIGLYRMDEKESDWDALTIMEQIQYSRQNTKGNAFFRASYLINNKKGIKNEIRNNFYNYPALLPPLTWLKETRPDPPGRLRLTPSNNSILLSWEAVGCFGKEDIFYNVYRSKSECVDTSDASNLVAVRIANHALSIPIDNSCTEEGYYYAVTSYDRYHNESEASEPIYFKVNSKN